MSRLKGNFWRIHKLEPPSMKSTCAGCVTPPPLAGQSAPRRGIMKISRALLSDRGCCHELPLSASSARHLHKPDTTSISYVGKGSHSSKVEKAISSHFLLLPFSFSIRKHLQFRPQKHRNPGSDYGGVRLVLPTYTSFYLYTFYHFNHL